MIRIAASRSVGVSQAPAHMYDAAVSLARLESFCSALEAQLGLGVSAVQTRSNAELMARFDAEEVELAWLPPLLAFQAMKHAKALPLLAPVRGGTMSFFAALFVPDGAPLESVIDLRGHRVAWVDRASASGYAVVRAALRASGADLTRLFGRETFEGSHRAVVHAVLGGTADVGATYVHRGADGRLLQSGWGDAKARPIFEHGPIPADVLSVAPRVADVIVKAILKAVLVSRDADLMRATREMFEAERLEPVGREHLASLEPLFAHLEE